jgi:adenylylsulfate kinase-like enzyme
MIYWFTGQPGHGKTVQATLLLNYFNEGVSFSERAFHIDGDHLRDLVYNKDYSREGREANIRLAQSMTKYLHNNGFNVVVSLVAPYKELREQFKQDMGTDIVEIYVHTDEIRGREHFHTQYEEPTENFIDLCTAGEDPNKTFERLLDLLDEWEGVM